MALDIVSIASGGSVFAHLIIWHTQEEIMEGGGTLELQRFVAVHGVIFGGVGSKNVCGACNTLFFSLFEPSKLHQDSYLYCVSDPDLPYPQRQQSRDL